MKPTVLRRSLRQGLKAAARTLPAGPIALGQLAAVQGSGIQGELLTLMALLCLLPIPGVGTAIGVALVLYAVEMWRKGEAADLPASAARVCLPRKTALRLLATWEAGRRLAGRFARERMTGVISAGRRSSAALITGALALVIVLPLPFGNILPALALLVLGIAMSFRDGALFLAAVAAAVCALFGTAALYFGLLLWTLTA